MQEVTIRPRSAFKHYVTVSTSGKELCWNFQTKKKNISFGLFRKASFSPSPTYAASPPTARNSSTTTTGVRSSRSEGLSVPSAGNVDGSSPSPSPRPSLVDVDNSSTPSGSLPAHSGRWSTTQQNGKSPPSDPELIEIIPTTHYDSSKFTIKGQYYVEEPGTYVLLFDNTFSVNTSKKLLFFVALRDVNPDDEVPRISVVNKPVEGWILKKGNRKMQGYTKRWMRIDPDGSLTYYRGPGGESRGFVSLPKTAIRVDHDHLLIDIDSGDLLMHLKAITVKEFQMWVEALQHHAESKAMNLEAEDHFITTGDEEMSAAIPLPSQSQSMADEALLRAPLNPAAESVSFAGETDAEALFRRLDDAIKGLARDLAQMKDLIDTSRSRIDSKTQWKDFALILSSISDVTSGLLNNSTTLQRGLQNYASSTRLGRDRLTFNIRQTELALRSAIADSNKIRRKFGLETVSLNNFLPQYAGSIPSSIRGIGILATKSGTSSVRDDIYYDAEEQELFHSGDEDDDSVTSDYKQDNEELFYDQGADEDLGDGVYDDDEDDYGDPIDAENIALVASYEPDTNAESILLLDRDASNSDADQKIRFQSSDADVAVPLTPQPSTRVPSLVRRKMLPAPTVSMENISILSILRNNVGKDLSQVAMPIALNEPLNLLQKLAEELEYYELLEKAGAAENPIDRIILVAAFAVSGYASTVNRAGRKPFNPLLGETYECIREDKGFRFISEKVSHHPPIMACFADSPTYQFFQDNLVKTKFWGKSMELIPSGNVHVRFPKWNEEYSWGKVTTCMRNIFSGGRYLEHYGTMKIISSKSGFTCQLTFKETGFFTSAKNEVVGTIYSSSGDEVAWLSGKWDDSICRYDKATPNNLEVIWRSRACPPHHAQMYGFTAFAVELNELTPDIAPMLPTTDTRFRTDQRMYEEGRAEEAEREKLRLEQKQRDFRKKLETEGKKWEPQWFELVPGPTEDGGESFVWRYKGGYFETREKRGFRQDISLF